MLPSITFLARSSGWRRYWAYTRRSCPSNVDTPLGNRPCNPNAWRCSVVKAVPRLIIGLVSTDLPRARIRIGYPSAAEPSSYGSLYIATTSCRHFPCRVPDCRPALATCAWSPADLRCSAGIYIGAAPAVGGLRFGGGFLADCSPGSGRGRCADGARECAVLAGDVS